MNEWALLFNTQQVWKMEGPMYSTRVDTVEPSTV